MASQGYPIAYEKGFEISVPAELADSVYVAGATLENGKLKSAGGRVLGVTAVADTLKDAVDAAYEKVGRIRFENAVYRHDIGKKALRAAEEGN